MPYEVVYDITRVRPFDIEVAWLAGGVVLLGVVWAVVQKRRQVSATTGYILMGFGSLIALLGVGVMSWDHARLVSALERGEAQVSEGLVQSWSTERQRTARSDKREYRTYESFYVGDAVWFGYHWEVGQAGFHNSGATTVPLRDGLQVRVTHVRADGEEYPPRILKLEIAR